MICKNKVVVIGCGNVGLSYCYALLNQKTKVEELVLIDIDMERVKGEVMDLNNGVPFAPSKIIIKEGFYEDCKDASLIVVSAGLSQKVGETRLDLLQKNYEVFKSIIKKVMENEFNGIFLVATNPVDIMTYITLKESNLPPEKVIGSGTTLDTARLKYNISKRLNIASENVHAYVIGEHGDSEMVPWSIANIGPEPLSRFINEEEKKEIEEEVKNAAYEIINKKGSTHYGIGMCLAKITEAIFENENSILTVSSYDKVIDIYIGTPTVVNKLGAISKMNLKLTEEKIELIKSMKLLRETIQTLNL